MPDDLRPLTSIRHVIDWMRAHGLPLESLDVITKDEFTHDVLVPLGASGACAVFGVS